MGTGLTPVQRTRAQRTVAVHAAPYQIRLVHWTTPGVRRPVRQFESGRGCHLASIWRKRALRRKPAVVRSNLTCKAIDRGVVLEWPVPGFEYRGGFVSPWGSNPAPFAWRHPRPVRPSVGRLPLRQRTQVRVLHGSPTAGVAHPGPSCRPAGPRWTTHKESRHAVPRGA
jgi:hypothetical protein